MRTRVMAAYIVVLFAILSTRTCRADAIEEELAKFQGRWELVSARSSGKDIAEDEAKKFSVVISGKKHSVFYDGRMIVEGVSFTVDPTKSPKEVTDKIETGVDKGKVIRGIYKLEGDTLTACVARPDGPRPTEFTADEGSGRSLRVFHRDKSETPKEEDDATRAERLKFEGTWKFESLEVDGQKIPGEALTDFRLILKGATFTSKTPEGTLGGTYTLDVTKTPKTIDITFKDGPAAGTTARGIYELDDETYRVCVSVGGGSRPTEFVSNPKSGHALEVLKRVKP